MVTRIIFVPSQRVQDESRCNEKQNTRDVTLVIIAAFARAHQSCEIFFSTVQLRKQTLILKVLKQSIKKEEYKYRYFVQHRHLLLNAFFSDQVGEYFFFCYCLKRSKKVNNFNLKCAVDELVLQSKYKYSKNVLEYNHLECLYNCLHFFPKILKNFKCIRNTFTRLPDSRLAATQWWLDFLLIQS